MRERFSLDDEVREAVLVEDLLTLLARTFKKVAVIDGDIGQSHLGPPTTIGWGLVQNKFESWKKTPLRDFGTTLRGQKQFLCLWMK